MKYDYAKNNPGGWCGDPKRGAALGRVDFHGDHTLEVKLCVRKVPLNSGGYDSLGTYWGHGEYLYVIATQDSSIEFFERCSTREKAKAYAKTLYPNARFYR